jgi:hypothetical protein
MVTALIEFRSEADPFKDEVEVTLAGPRRATAGEIDAPRNDLVETKNISPRMARERNPST